MKKALITLMLVFFGSMGMRAQNEEYTIATKAGKWGIQRNDKWTVKPKYLEIKQLGNVYFVLEKKGKYSWGDEWRLISSDGADLLGKVGGVPNILTEDRAIFCGKLIDDTGGVLYPNAKGYLSIIEKCKGKDEYGEDEFDKALLGGRLFLKVKCEENGQKLEGVVDIDGNVIFPPVYKYAGLFYNGTDMRFCVATKSDKTEWNCKVALYDLDGKEVMPFIYSNHCYVYATDHPELIKVNCGTNEFVCVAIPTRDNFFWKGSFKDPSFYMKKDACEIVISDDGRYTQIAKSKRDKFFSKRDAYSYHTYYVNGHFYPLIPRPDPATLPNPFAKQ